MAISFKPRRCSFPFSSCLCLAYARLRYSSVSRRNWHPGRKRSGRPVSSLATNCKNGKPSMRIRDFVSKLQETGDLVVVDEEVAREQIPLMIKNEETGRNRAILFRNIRGHSVPVVANL